MFQKGYIPWNKGKINHYPPWNKGKHLSAEHRKNIAEGEKGKKLSEEVKQK